MIQGQQLSQTLQRMKSAYEEAIAHGTRAGLIKSGRLISLLHEYVVAELTSRIDPNGSGLRERCTDSPRPRTRTS